MGGRVDSKGDMMELLSSGERKARKLHRCFWCQGVIKTGERYYREAQVYCGDFYEIKCHILCKKVADIWHSEYVSGEYEIDSEFFYDYLLDVKANKKLYQEIIDEGIEDQFAELCAKYGIGGEDNNEQTSNH